MQLSRTLLMLIKTKRKFEDDEPLNKKTPKTTNNNSLINIRAAINRQFADLCSDINIEVRCSL